MPQHPGKKKKMTPAQERTFIKANTSPAERAAINKRSKNTPGTRAAERNADRTGSRKAASRALSGPAKAAHAGQLSRARRNNAKKRK